MYSIVSTSSVLSSCVVFWAFNKFLDDHSEPVKVPDKYKYKFKCKWRNVMGSILHAVVVSVIGFYCIYISPEYMTERVTTHTTLGEINVCITIGYLVYDAIDLVRFQGVFSTWPILVHHLTLHFLGFGCVMYHRLSIAYALCGSMIELNSVFLHGRQLLLMYGFSKHSFLYKVNNVFNILSYIIFRFVGGSIMLFYFLPSDYGKLPTFWFYAYGLSITTLLVINIILFYRLMRSDFFTRGYRGGNIMQQTEVTDVVTEPVKGAVKEPVMGLVTEPVTDQVLGLVTLTEPVGQEKIKSN